MSGTNHLTAQRHIGEDLIFMNSAVRTSNHAKMDFLKYFPNGPSPYAMNERRYVGSASSIKVQVMKFSWLKYGVRNSVRTLQSLCFLMNRLQNCGSSSHLAHL
jgi:hypothetical protein